MIVRVIVVAVVEVSVMAKVVVVVVACYPLNPLLWILQLSTLSLRLNSDVLSLLLNKPARTGCELSHR